VHLFGNRGRDRLPDFSYLYRLLVTRLPIGYESRQDRDVRQSAEQVLGGSTTAESSEDPLHVLVRHNAPLAF